MQKSQHKNMKKKKKQGNMTLPKVNSSTVIDANDMEVDELLIILEMGVSQTICWADLQP
jgi:hypothetical protein